ncbi:hypothetical protein ACT3OH_15835 [Vreelandella zhanjiangensis]|uniref:hypothetical protein n=1 Tax=Vreelandella zhanjiangensis TaxID=1121960 RepID=UPI00402AD80A
MLALFRRHRHQLALLGMGPCETFTLARELPEQWLEATIQAEITLQRLPQPVPLYWLAAVQLITEDASLQKLMAYLTASSLACSAPKVGATDMVQEALERLHALEKSAEQTAGQKEKEKLLSEEAESKREAVEQENTQLSQELQSHWEENALLLEQLHSVQEALEEALLQHKDNATVLAQAEQKRDTHASALEKEKKHHKAAAKALKNAEQKVTELQKNAQQLLLQLKQAETNRAKAQETAKSVAKEMSALKAAQKARAQTEKQLQAYTQTLNITQEENELLLTQLHSVQEALKTTYLNAQADNMQTQHDTHQQIHKLKSVITWLRAHAYRHAVAAYRDSRSYKKTLPRLISLLEHSELFDADWYRAQYKDVAETNINPAEHFIKFGAIEGRNPSPLFNTEFYLENHPDVAVSGQHPLLHYLRDGIKEQRGIKEVGV